MQVKVTYRKKEIKKPKKVNKKKASITFYIAMVILLELCVFNRSHSYSAINAVGITIGVNTPETAISQTEVKKVVENVVEEKPEVVEVSSSTRVPTDKKEPEPESIEEETESVDDESNNDESTVEEVTATSYRYNASEKEYEILCRIVEAEVTGTEDSHNITYDEMYESKLHVAQVILNRVDSQYFPNNIEMVVFQRNQFSPIHDGRYYSVKISQITKDACSAALLSSTKDTTEGAMYFKSGSDTSFAYGSYLFTDAVGHHFYTDKREV